MLLLYLWKTAQDLLALASLLVSSRIQKSQGEGQHSIICDDNLPNTLQTNIKNNKHHLNDNKVTKFYSPYNKSFYNCKNKILV